MADEPLFDPFVSDASRDRWIATNVPLEVWELPTAQVGDFMRSIGVSISNQRLGDIRREIFDGDLYTDRVQGLSHDDVVPRSWLYERHGLQLSSNFQYRALGTLINRKTGEQIVGARLRVSTDGYLTVGSALDLIKQRVEISGTDTDWIVEDLILTGVFARPGIK